MARKHVVRDLHTKNLDPKKSHTTLDKERKFADNKDLALSTSDQEEIKLISIPLEEQKEEQETSKEEIMKKKMDRLRESKKKLKSQEETPEKKTES